MTAVPVDNQFDALQRSPIDIDADTKESTRSRKDDLKEQAFQAREGVKLKATQLKEQIVSGVSQGVDLLKAKAAQLTGDSSITEKSNEELVEEVQDKAATEWQEVKSRGKAKAKKLAHQAEEQLDENLTPEQKQKLQRGLQKAKSAGNQGLKQAKGFSRGAFSKMFSGVPQLRGFKNWIERNNLQLPFMIAFSVLFLYTALSVIRIVTMVTTPKVPEFDIHSKEASMNWLKYHAGEFKDKAVDLKDSMPGRVAAFLANHELDKIQENAINWKEIGMKRLGLTEPSYGEQLWAYMTGHPITWRERVESVLDLGMKGLKASSLKQGLDAGSDYIKSNVHDAKESLGLGQPTFMQRLRTFVTGHDATLKGQVQEKAASFSDRVGDYVDSIRDSIPGLHRAPVVEPSIVDKLKAGIQDGIDGVRSRLPGGAEAIEEARARAYAATHPSTLDNLRSGAEYIKNRVVHGAEEAKHIAQDRAQEAIDKAKYKTGL